MATEKRLIDANALKSKAWPEEVTGEGIVYVEDIDTAPTVDAVEVVRCKECKHCTVTSDGMVCECALPTKHIQDYFVYGSTILARVEPEAFCSYGERRTDEG